MSEYGVLKPAFLNPDMAAIATRFKAYKCSHAAFIRIFLTDFIDADWVLYSDVDTLWMRDVAELWNLRDNAASIMWCQDLPSIAKGVHEYAKKWNPEFDEAKYCCSGVTLMNLKRLREMNLPERCIEFVSKWGTPFFVDQDILNYVCREDAKILPQHWDCLVPTREAVNGLVYHFTGIGAMFNSSFSGWRPLYYPWFRFYYDHILKEPRRIVCPWFKRILFWVLGTFYPPECLLSLFLPKNKPIFDNIRRQVFFAWLWRHAKWRKAQ